MNTVYSEVAPSRSEVDALTGATVVEFGTNWCGFCQAAQPLLASVIDRHPGLRHIKVEDGPGRALGRSFRVKLWPTLILMRDGQEISRLVRPDDVESIERALGEIDPV